MAELSSLDWSRFGRQLALFELGAEGQLALAHTPVFFAAETPNDPARALAVQLHTRAGGNTTSDPSAVTITLVPWNTDESFERTLARATFAVMDACRSVAMKQAAGIIPDALLLRFF